MMIGLWPLYYFLLPFTRRLLIVYGKRVSAVTGAFGTMWKEAQVAHWQIVPINFVRLAQVIADPTAENVFNLVKKN